MSFTQENLKYNGKMQQQQRVQTISKAGSVVSKQVSAKRRDEIYGYLKLFGYKADKTIIQVHVTGFFRRKGQQADQKEKARQAAAIKRYGGVSFVIVGRTHDPSIIENVIKPKKRNPLDTSPGYIGYLWKNKDPQKRAPHEVIPLDFTPINLPYPTEWKSMFATKGFMLALHVPSSFVRYKNRLTRALYRIGRGGPLDIRNEWRFLDDLRLLGFNNVHAATTSGIKYTQSTVPDATNSSYTNQNEQHEDPVTIVKRRLAKGEISKEEYDELRRAIQS
ncbi:MAG TPA: SHOCT domain-containing protein [Nitrososphaeraceae archaeon]|nr:SHOCT domain-containing protein [Nitrososphaeraceae archaeon]